MADVGGVGCKEQSSSFFAPARAWNHDARERRLFDVRALASFRLRTQEWPWQERQTVQLGEVMRAQVLEDSLRRLCTEGADTASEEEKQRIAFGICDRLESATDDVDSTMREWGNTVDWISVSEKLNVASTAQKLPFRTPSSCKIQHAHYLDGSLNRSPFGPGEDKALVRLAEKHGGYDWERVAKELGTTRNSWQCFARYHAVTTAPSKTVKSVSLRQIPDEERMADPKIDEAASPCRISDAKPVTDAHDTVRTRDDLPRRPLVQARGQKVLWSAMSSGVSVPKPGKKSRTSL